MKKTQVLKPSIDLFKLIMAYAVVAIHTNPLALCTIDLINDIYKTLVAFAVPFFFFFLWLFVRDEIGRAIVLSNKYRSM